MENGTDDITSLEPSELVARVRQGKDELNLAEFPLSAISERTDPAQKTLTFEDKTWDDSRGEMVTRQLTITASDQYGLPTALDDEVILGLVQLSKLRNFSDRKVSFTRYQLIHLLGWRDESKSYERLERSLNRWIGVTLFYKNAWWDKDNKSWVDEKFHILDNVTLYDREKAKIRRAASGGQQPLPLSTFTWNDVLFRSFNAGNLKSIDFDFYKQLDSSIAKRLYRFLDKRFFRRSRWEFDLKEMSWEHVGLSRNYDAANLKRKLAPAIAELVAAGFLVEIPEHERFKKVRSGEWRVVFEHQAASKARVSGAGTNASESPDTQLDPLMKALTERGVTPSTAASTVGSFAKDRILAQLEVFDWLIARGDQKVARNPAGFLISSIKSEYVPPPGFITKDEQQKRKRQADERKRKAEEKAEVERQRQLAQDKAKTNASLGFWESLSETERERLEAEALASATQIQRDVIARGGSFARVSKKALLDAYALKMLQAAA